MVDFHACQWPASLPAAHDTSLAEYFDNLNEPSLSNLQARRRRAAERPRVRHLLIRLTRQRQLIRRRQLFSCCWGVYTA